MQNNIFSKAYLLILFLPIFTEELKAQEIGIQYPRALIKNTFASIGSGNKKPIFRYEQIQYLSLILDEIDKKDEEDGEEESFWSRVGGWWSALERYSGPGPYYRAGLTYKMYRIRFAFIYAYERKTSHEFDITGDSSPNPYKDSRVQIFSFQPIFEIPISRLSVGFGFGYNIFKNESFDSFSEYSMILQAAINPWKTVRLGVAANIYKQFNTEDFKPFIFKFDDNEYEVVREAFATFNF